MSSSPKSPGVLGHVPPWIWLILGIVFAFLAGGRFNVGILGWIAALPWLLHLRQTHGWKNRLWLVLAMQIGVALNVAKLVTPPLTFLFIPAFSLPIATSNALLFILFEWMRRRLGDRGGLVLFPALVVAAEWIGWRSSEFGSWGAVAYTQLDNPVLLQSLSLFGLSTLAALLSVVSALLAIVLSTPTPLLWRREMFVVSALVGLTHLYGSLRLQRALPPNTLTVAAVGTDLLQSGDGLPPAEEIARGTDTLFERTRRAGSRGAQVVVWNEGATWVEEANEAAFIERAQALAREVDIEIVLAYVVPQGNEATFENKYMWVTPEGVAQEYWKRHPVPGEGAIPGTGAIEVLERPYGKVAGAICYDYDYPGLAREHAQQGAGLVVVPSSDWRGINPFHTQMAMVRGIEGGFTVLRSVRMATSGAYDALGQTRASMSWFDDEEKIMLARVPVQRIWTLYSSIGDVFAWGCLGWVVLGLVRAMRRR